MFKVEELVWGSGTHEVPDLESAAAKMRELWKRDVPSDVGCPSMGYLTGYYCLLEDKGDHWDCACHLLYKGPPAHDPQ